MQTADTGKFSRLTLSLETGRSEYLPGEPIEFIVQVKNNSAVPIIAHRKVGIGYGYLKILVAANGGEFKKYLGPQWGLKDSHGYFITTLAPGESLTESASILYNHPTRTRKSISTRYALPGAGTYCVKAVFYNLGFNEEIESSEISLQMKEPQGIDAAVWQEIKPYPQYARFIQTGGATLEAAQVAAALRKIQEAYPKSSYAKLITAALKKYNAR